MIFTGTRVFNSISLYSVEDVIVCPQKCGKKYKTNSGLKKHLKYECNKLPQFKCLFCDKMAKRPDNLKQHMILMHGYINKLHDVPFHPFNETYVDIKTMI